MKKLPPNSGLWAVYVFLLVVLLPHTAWAFSQFEQNTATGLTVAWFGACAFEFAILVLTHKLAKRIEVVPKYKSRWHRFTARYFNAYSAGLLVAIGVSMLANLAHAVEFGQQMKLFGTWSDLFGVYVVAFGAVLPLTSLLFARVLAADAVDEQEVDPALVEAKQKIAELQKSLNTAREATQFLPLVTGSKQERIQATAQMWPKLGVSGVAVVVGAAPSYVSEVLGKDGHGTEAVKGV